MKEKILAALNELRKQEKRNFTQSVDLIINLKDFNVKADALNILVILPHPTAEKKICAFLEKPNNHFDFTVTRADFARYQNKKDVKKLVKQYDFFVATAALMPAIATTFGRYLGPAGKMPSPQLGVIPNDDEGNVKEVIRKIRNTNKIKTKEASIKFMIGKEEMSNEELTENAIAVYSAVLNALPKKLEGIRNIMLKFTMSKPIKIKVKD